MKRILLFVATNFAVLMVISLVFKLFGFEGLLQANNVDLNLQAVLVYAAIAGFAGSLISLFMSKGMAKRSMGVQIIEQPTTPFEHWLMQTVAKQSRESGIKMPEVGIFDSPDPNAFATGANRNNALVAVSSGLLQHMSQDEVEAVLAHEVSHVANGDMITLALIQGVVNTFVIFLSRVIGHLVDRVVFKTERGHGPAFWITAIAAELVLGILASVIVKWFSRQREYRADAGGASLAGRDKMIAALERLRAPANQPGLPDQLAAFGISGGGNAFTDLFRTHPRLEDRIQALRNQA